MPRRAFTLIELLVVIAIMALLIGILLPVLGKARQTGRTAKCLVQMQQLEYAHTLYINTYKEQFIDAGLAHGGSNSLAKVRRAWPVVLSELYGSPLVLRSPGDTSRYWPVSQGGTSTRPSLDQILEQIRSGGTPDVSKIARWTSYGINNWTSRTLNPGMDRSEPFDRLSKIAFPSQTVHFLMMTEGDGNADYAYSDHVHAESWSDADFPPGTASSEMEIAAWGGPPKSFASIANYAFLDGHAETLRFDRVYTDFNRNMFYPNARER
ncbi:MAG: hypothetical protein GIKADHBN_01990 [Phycisphaerales bacterium]|nr:hypothetical protein [Phycisphaerales bacterium]